MKLLLNAYNVFMAQREVSTQLDEDLVERLSKLAKALGTSRSELLRRGALAIIGAERQIAADADFVEAYRKQPPDLDFIQATALLAARTAPSR